MKIQDKLLWVLNHWKPIHLCWWFIKHNRPIPRYFIGKAPVVAAFAQAHYRFYNDDGSESTSTPKANEDTAISLNVDANANLHLRITLDETAGGAPTNPTTVQLQYSLNGGTFTNITTTSSVAKGFNSTNLTNDGATTNRGTNGLTDPTGTFEAGVQCEDGALANTLNAGNFTEHVWALTIVAADVANGNTVTFRMLYGGATITYTVTPTINVTKTGATRVKDIIGAGLTPRKR